MKTLLIDGNNIMMRALFTEGVLIKDPNDKKKVIDYDWDWFELSIFKSIYFAFQHAKNITEIVFAMDNKQSWRKTYWKRYKENRDKNRYIDADFTLVFEKYYNLMEDIKTHFPIKVLNVKFCEGDDIIGTIVLNTPQNHYIVSVDKDYQQLYQKNRVTIYNPLKQTTVSHPNTEQFIIEQSLLGQAKDNIFNIKTPFDHPKDKRKPGFGPKALEKVLIYGWKKWLKEKNLTEHFEFNRNLIDFKRIPKAIQKAIMKEYNIKNYPEPEKMYDFMSSKTWDLFTEEWSKIENLFLNLY